MSNDERQANIYEYTGKDGRTYYSVCHWDEFHGQYQVPMDAEEQRLTGCHTKFARNYEQLGKMDHDKAYRKARKRYGYAKKAQ